MFREIRKIFPLIDIEPKPTFRFGIRGYTSGSFFDYDLVEPECVNDMGMLSMLFDKYVNKFKDEGVLKKCFINC